MGGGTRGLSMLRILLYLGIGLVVGTLSGVLGIGGGVLLVPALVWLGGMDQEHAAGTTLAVLVVPVVLPAVLAYAEKGKVNVEAAVWLGLAFALGSYIGAQMLFNLDLPQRQLRLLFGLMMIYIAIRFILMSDSEALTAASGLIAVTVSWLSFLCLRALGRRYPPRPRLGEEIQHLREQGHGDADYTI